ncbi:TIGR03862 family flavoprotein [Rhodoferax sp. PAMC 29310]|uniref:TIGR03862 family flavoprotein n=1 Tax=Rhodoferax sp. PAMC 29310 TaxID=2822760 RepID=UPI001B337523|nr:TIGR03862 family flavoprotein [Rhodoferax sp. PAMC 29310]
MKKVIVVGGGPSGLMAADVLLAAGLEVHVYDAMPSVGRKFLLAGKGGLNLTHSEPADIFASRYGDRRQQVETLLNGFDNAQVRVWAQGLGIETFVGSSGRVFPADMKAAPLLRAWLHRLRHPATGTGVQFHMRHRWTGWANNESGAVLATTLNFDSPQGPVQVAADAVVLALGGGSWARLGSNGAWVPWLQAAGVSVAPLLPSNCGFEAVVLPPAPEGEALPVQAVPASLPRGWSEHFTTRFAGQPFKSVAIQVTTSKSQTFQRKGEFVATATGVEGSLIYAASNLLRDEIVAQGHATFHLDLLPDFSAERVLAEVRHPRGTRSLSSHLKSRLHLEGIKMAILHELLSKTQINDPAQLAAAIKSLPIHLVAARPMDEAISTAGGVLFEVTDKNLMLEQLPGVFCAGEMLDWEAPTGGYLLTACFASGKAAGEGVVKNLDS